jgi:hypothetical protein
MARHTTRRYEGLLEGKSLADMMIKILRTLKISVCICVLPAYEWLYVTMLSS